MGHHPAGQRTPIYPGGSPADSGPPLALLPERQSHACPLPGADRTQREARQRACARRQLWRARPKSHTKENQGHSNQSNRPQHGHVSWSKGLTLAPNELSNHPIPARSAPAVSTIPRPGETVKHARQTRYLSTAPRDVPSPRVFARAAISQDGAGPPVAALARLSPSATWCRGPSRRATCPRGARPWRTSAQISWVLSDAALQPACLWRS